MPQPSRTLEPPFTGVPGALDEIRAGHMVVVVDDEDRENEGDLTLAAEHVTPEAINFMARYGRGLICLTLTEERADHLRLFPMTQQNSSRFGTAFTETIEAREGVTTGISAADRARTIRTAIDSKTTFADLARPGHVFPLRARRGGVLVRAGQTEASVDLARLAGLTPAGVICEIMRDDGEMARIPDLIPSAGSTASMITVAEAYPPSPAPRALHRSRRREPIQTRYGEFRMIAYESEVNGGESHIALVRGDLCPDCPAFHLGPAQAPTANGAASESRPPCPHPVLVRVHTRCTPGDVFAADCRCREVLDRSMRMIADEGCGVILYLHNTSRGFSIEHTPAAAFGPGGAGRPPAHRRRTPAVSSFTRNCAPAKAHRPAAGVSCAPSASAARFCRTWESSASGCCRIRPCTSPLSKALASKSLSRCRSRWRNATAFDASRQVAGAEASRPRSGAFQDDLSS